MRLVDSVLSYLAPEMLITDPDWREKWDLRQKENFLRYAGFFYLAVGAGQIANYFFFDVPMGLEPQEFWLNYRITMALICGACTIYYFSPLTRFRLFKAPALIASAIICYTQAYVSIWYSIDAWIFFYIFVMISAMVLAMKTIWSLTYSFVLCTVGAPVLQEAGVLNEYTMSATLVTLVFTGISQRSGLSNVRSFLLNEENVAQQTRIAEISGEFAARIQSFIPRVIADRMSHHLDDGMSVVEASIEALKAKKANVACLFTDIRGFTQGSKELDEFIIESVMPEVTACSNAIEDFYGIPRKVGDLIFAYFDDESIHINVIRAIRAGIEVSRLNETMNLSSSQKHINRYILISAGQAMVGNFGGLDSSVEITALGTPVNFLSRVDELTKAPAIAKLLRSGDIILSDTAMETLEQLDLPIDLVPLELERLNLSIRDFPEVRTLYKLTPTLETEALLSEILTKIDSEQR